MKMLKKIIKNSNNFFTDFFNFENFQLLWNDESMVFPNLSIDLQPDLLLLRQYLAYYIRTECTKNKSQSD